jgi:hypothetical protein
MFFKIRHLFLLGCCFLLFSFSAFASPTPDLWSQHVTGSGFRFTMDDTDLGFGTLKLGLTSRYSSTFSDTNNQQFYQYLRAYLSDIEVGGGTVRVNLNLRGATTIEGYNANPYSVYSPNITDSRFMKRDEEWDLRIYDASVVLDNVIPYSVISAGRIRINHLSSWRIDGGEIVVGNNNINGYLFGGIPASYYQWVDQKAYGGGLNTAFLDNTLRLRGEVVYFDIAEEEEFESTLYWNVRGDCNFRLPNLIDSNLYGIIGQVEKVTVWEVGLFGDILLSNTTFNGWLRGQYERNDKYVSPTVSEFEYVIGPQSEYLEAGGDLYQFLGGYFGLGAGVSGRMNYNQWYGDRDYTRVHGNFDVFGLISGNYLSIRADYYFVPEWGLHDEQQQLFIGGRMSQDIGERAAFWVGAGVTSYQFNRNNFVRHPFPQYDDSRINDNVYTAYVGARANLTNNIMIQADYMYEMSNVIKSMYDKNAESHYVQLWLNIGY